MKSIFLIAAFALLTLPAYAAASAGDGGAAKVVAGFYARLTEAMQAGSQLSFAERVRKLEPAVQSAFNMQVMTKLAVGPSWSSATPDEQQQLVAAFTTFSAANYARNFAQDNGEQFKVLDEKPFSGGAMVDSDIQPKTGDAVPVNYLLRKNDSGQWQIVDIYLNGSISELASRRQDFSGIAQRDGIPALINNLDEKAKALGPG